MNLSLDNTDKSSCSGNIQIPGSKSESNRLLILQQLFPSITIENLSTADDTNYLKKALLSNSGTIDIGNAGTSMRFLTAYFASQQAKAVTLTGSTRMYERPIKILVAALIELGADISYVKYEGFPPLLIKGKKLSGGKIHIKGNVSSQYISALLLVAPSFSKGLTVELDGDITSMPYIQMTLKLLKKMGINTSFKNNIIHVEKSKISPETSGLKSKIFKIEPDWTSASYFYSIAALQPNTHIDLVGFKRNSLQGDSVLPEIYRQFGVETIYTSAGVTITSKKRPGQFKPSYEINLALENTPDLAQTIAVSCLGLGINCHLTGLSTLKIKETNRLKALKNELEKLGASVKITDDSLKLISPAEIDKLVHVKTYKDHRMAMAFAPLSLQVPIVIEDSNVVSKSYPTFWQDFDFIMDK